MKPKFDPDKPAVCVFNCKRLPARMLGRRKTTNSGSPPVVYLVDYGGLEHGEYFFDDGTSISANKYLVNIPEKRTVWRYTVVAPGSMLPDTFYRDTEEIAREGCAEWETVEGATVLEPPHPFEYEVPE